MLYPREKEFIRLGRKWNVVSVYKEIFSDTETPVSAYLKIDPRGHSYLLESVEGEEKVARFSFLGINPEIVFSSKGRDVRIVRYHHRGPKEKTIKAKANPLDELQKIASYLKFAPLKGLPRFSGGFVGYLGYDMARFFEPRLSRGCHNKSRRDRLNAEDSYFIFARDLIVFDHLRKRLKIIVNTYIPREKKTGKGSNIKQAYQQAKKRIEEIEDLLRKPIGPEKISLGRKGKGNLRRPKIRPNISRPEFKRIVRRAKEYIRQGEIIQVVLSQRFSCSVKQRPFDIYRRLRAINPSPYMYYLNFPGISLAGSSPEMFVRCENGKVEMRPIAGTRKRGKDAKEDNRLSRELLADAKERAEHLMLVDLGRNDLGRVCSYGTVNIDEFMAVEKYSHVMHIVSNLSGRLNRQKDAFKLIASTFPAGTVSGAPKIRAMEIIAELEKDARGPYAGCVGYLGLNGNLDTCITIRTIVIKGRQAYIQAGAGIVADSDPDKEYTETLNKARAQIEAIGG